MTDRAKIVRSPHPAFSFEKNQNKSHEKYA